MVVTLAISWVGLLVINSLLVLPAAAARNVAKNMRQYVRYSVLAALLGSVGGLLLSYAIACSAGAAISLLLTAWFILSTLLRRD